MPEQTAKITRRVTRKRSASGNDGTTTPAGHAGSGSKGGRTMAGATAGALPLVLALIAGSVTGNHGQPSQEAIQHGTNAAKCEEVADFRACHADYPTGCSAAGGYDAYLNLLKNKLELPSLAQQDPVLDRAAFEDLNKNTPEELSKTNHEQFKDDLAKLGEGKQRELIGYLYYAKLSGAESSNCGLTDPEAVDYHIGIGFDSGLAEKLRTNAKLTPQEHKAITQTSIIVEMTPEYRATFHPEWSDIKTVTDVVGKQVKVTGQLIVDSEHNNGSQNCGFTGGSKATCWRLSAWELHPVTGFAVCGKDSADCSPKDSNWADLQETNTQGSTQSASNTPRPTHVSRTKKGAQP